LESELAAIKEEIKQIKSKVFVENEEKAQEIEKLKEELIIHKMNISSLKLEKESLLATIGILSSNKAYCLNTMPPFSIPSVNAPMPFPMTPMENQPSETCKNSKQTQKEETETKKRKKKKKKQNKRPSQQNQQNGENKKATNETTANSTPNTPIVIDEDDHEDECKPDKQHTVVIGHSILSKLESWRMSNRANKVKVDPHSCAVVEDLKDYINPILRRKPDNIILHIGTNPTKSLTKLLKLQKL